MRTSQTSAPQAGPPTAPEASLAIICGGGSLPTAVANAVTQRGRRAVLFPVRGWADAAAIEPFAHHWINVAQAGRFRRLARNEGCRDVVFIGSAMRMPIRDFRFDWLTLRLLPRIVSSYYGGDDRLLTGVARIFEDYGFRILGAHEVAPEILIPSGPVGGIVPTARDRADIARGLAVLRAIGPFDVGQAVVVANNHVLAIEAAEGTDAMLARVADLRAGGRVATAAGIGVLVKAPKAGQDRRIDLPAIGPRTVEAAARAGLAGIAVVAGSTIIAEPAEVARAADAARLFVDGIDEAAA